VVVIPFLSDLVTSWLYFSAFSLCPHVLGGYASSVVNFIKTKPKLDICRQSKYNYYAIRYTKLMNNIINIAIIMIIGEDMKLP